MRAIDAWILALCQQFCNWLTKTFGVAYANRKLAYLCFSAAAFGLVAGGVVLFRGDSILGAFMSVNGFIVGCGMFILWQKIPTDIGTRPEPRIGISLQIIRLAGWSSLITDISVLMIVKAKHQPLGEGYQLCLLGYLAIFWFSYFVSCRGQPRRPQQVLLREVEARDQA